MAQITAFGRAIKIKLIDMERTQVWLIEQVKAKTGLYFDSFYLHKILTGRIMTPKIVQAICEVLDLPETIQGAAADIQ